MTKSLYNRIQDLHHIAINLERALTQKHLQLPGHFCHVVEYELFKQTYKKCIAEIENGNCDGNPKTCESSPCNSRNKSTDFNPIGRASKENRIRDDQDKE